MLKVQYNKVYQYLKPLHQYKHTRLNQYIKNKKGGNKVFLHIIFHPNLTYCYLYIHKVSHHN